MIHACPPRLMACGCDDVALDLKVILAEGKLSEAATYRPERFGWVGRACSIFFRKSFVLRPLSRVCGTPRSLLGLRKHLLLGLPRKSGLEVGRGEVADGAVETAGVIEPGDGVEDLEAGLFVGEEVGAVHQLVLEGGPEGPSMEALS